MHVKLTPCNKDLSTIGAHHRIQQTQLPPHNSEAMVASLHHGARL